MTTPKYHWLVHLPEYLDRMHKLYKDVFGYGWLQNCFVLERKHKVGKRYAEPRSNTNKMQSGSLLAEILCPTVHSLIEAPELNYGLCGARAPSKALRARVLSLLALDRKTQMLIGNRSYHSDTSFSDRGDFVVFTDPNDSSMRAGLCICTVSLQLFQ